MDAFKFKLLPHQMQKQLHACWRHIRVQKLQRRSGTTHSKSYEISYEDNNFSFVNKKMNLQLISGKEKGVSLIVTC